MFVFVPLQCCWQTGLFMCAFYCPPGGDSFTTKQFPQCSLDVDNNPTTAGCSNPLSAHQQAMSTLVIGLLGCSQPSHQRSLLPGATRAAFREAPSPNASQ